MTDSLPPDLLFLQWLIDECGYRDPRPIGGGRYACIRPKIYTHAVVTGRIGDVYGIDRNWCYETYAQAKTALVAWDGKGEPNGWFRDTVTGRRRARGPGEIDENGNVVEIGAIYVRP